jgi:hypothetical protein
MSDRAPHVGAIAAVNATVIAEVFRGDARAVPGGRFSIDAVPATVASLLLASETSCGVLLGVAPARAGDFARAFARRIHRC